MGFLGLDGEYLPLGSVNMVVLMGVNRQALGRMLAEQGQVFGFLLTASGCPVQQMCLLRHTT